MCETSMDKKEELKEEEIMQDKEELTKAVELTDNMPSVEDLEKEVTTIEDKEESLEEPEVEWVETIEKPILNIETTPELPLKNEKEKEEIVKEDIVEKEISSTTMQVAHDDVPATYNMQDGSNHIKSDIFEKPKRGRKPKQRNESKKVKKPEKAKKVEQEEEEEEEEEEEKEYEIEKILGHQLFKGKVVKYEIKWKGYGEEDNTVESATSIHDDVPDLCAAYWDSITEISRPYNAPASKVNKRKKTDVEKDVTNKKHKGNLEHVPQYMLEKGFNYPKSWPNHKTKWEIDMKELCAVQLSPIDQKMKLAYIRWNNGEQTIHTLEECHQKCPMKLIEYYEQRLRFV